MSVLPILRWPDPVLSQVCAEVTEFDDTLNQLAGDMLDTMYAAPGRGLAAPQVGVLKRVFVMDAGWKDGQPTPLIAVNPRLEPIDEERATGPEGCLSVPGVVADVARWTRVRLHWQSVQGEPQDRVLTGFEAICAQHETDHLDGVMHFDQIDAAARVALLAQYKDGSA